MDEWQFELAEKTAEEARQRAVAQLKEEAAADQQHAGFDGAHCVECGETLPAARVQAKRVRCVPCQAEREAQAARYHHQP